MLNINMKISEFCQPHFRRVASEIIFLYLLFLKKAYMRMLLFSYIHL